MGRADLKKTYYSPSQKTTSCCLWMNIRRVSREVQRAKWGFTLLELLIVVALLAILGLALLATGGWKIQLAKARDGKRKSDLKKMQNILEDYYNDHGRYPQTESIVCGAELSPYGRIPCDPLKRQSYLYMSCKGEQGYVLFANLENENDPAIEESQCSEGCELGIVGTYNYGIFSPNIKS